MDLLIAALVFVVVTGALYALGTALLRGIGSGQKDG